MTTKADKLMGSFGSKIAAMMVMPSYCSYLTRKKYEEERKRKEALFGLTEKQRAQFEEIRKTLPMDFWTALSYVGRDPMNPNTDEVVRDMANLCGKDLEHFQKLPDTPPFKKAAEEVLDGKDRAVATPETDGGRKLLDWAKKKKDEDNRCNKRKRQKRARRKNR